MTAITLYGIKSCDTMKKAMTWLNDNGVEYRFHDYKKEGISRPKLEEWLTKEQWDVLINKRGTTWRKLSDEDKSDVDNPKAVTLMEANTSLIKRPILEMNDKIYLGFKPEIYEAIFA